ncbi:MAG: CinA family protein [Asticcacaulis sp.]
MSPDLATEVIRLARERGLWLATAESCTGGLIAAALTDVPGSSAVLGYGVTTYSNAAKTRLLGVPSVLFETVGAVSEPVVAAMAEGALSLSGADLSVSVSGIAGPGGGTDTKPVGLVCFGLGIRGQAPQTQSVRFGAELDRATIRTKARDHALNLLLDHLRR